MKIAAKLMFMMNSLDALREIRKNEGGAGHCAAGM
jgi:hypothetical protein